MDSYLDIALKRQAILERLKSGQVRDFAKEIKKIDQLVRVAIGTLEDEFSNLTRAQLENLIALLRVDQNKVFAAATQSFLAETERLAAVYMNQELLDLNNTVDLRGTKLKSFTNAKLYKNVIQRPMGTNGDLLQPWVKNLTTTEINRVEGAIRAGHSRGLTNQQMIRSIVGTKSRNFQDGVLQTTRRNASTMVRTSVQHVASSARQELWEANKGVVTRYKFIATLDRKTSKQCRSLDSQEFDFGKGPVPPVHPNCRSTTIPVLNPKYRFLSTGRTRSAFGGPVSSDTSYYDWLRNQTASTQNDVLGKTRAKLFRDSGMSAEKFRALQFDRNFEPLTLKEMQRIEPQAFKRAFE